MSRGVVGYKIPQFISKFNGFDVCRAKGRQVDKFGVEGGSGVRSLCG